MKEYKYKCTNCNHVFDKVFKCGTSETALCPSCFSPAERVNTKTEYAEQLQSALEYAGKEAVKATLSSSELSREEYHALYKSHMRKAEWLSLKVFGE